MRAIVRGRTVIIIAHRLAAVRPCSRIVGMQRGEIVEVGSHEELLRREGGLEQRACGIAEADPTLVFDEDRDNVWEDAWKHRTEHL